MLNSQLSLADLCLAVGEEIKAKMIEIDFSFSGGLAGTDNAVDTIITLRVFGPEALEPPPEYPMGLSLSTGSHHLQKHTHQADL